MYHTIKNKTMRLQSLNITNNTKINTEITNKRNEKSMKIQNAWIWESFKNYCNHSTIHGLKNIIDNRKPFLDR